MMNRRRTTSAIARKIDFGDWVHGACGGGAGRGSIPCSTSVKFTRRLLLRPRGILGLQEVVRPATADPQVADALGVAYFLELLTHDTLHDNICQVGSAL